jgi:dihydroorotate dehydrogenase electron transfer subunit
MRGLDYEVSTLDGSMGKKGLITELLDAYCSANKDKLAKDSSKFACNSSGINDQPMVRAAACGPKGMLRAVTEKCLKEGVPIEVSLEEKMACGVGACLGCVCTVRTASGSLRRKRVCKEGPVFDGGEVVWNEEG